MGLDRSRAGINYYGMGKNRMTARLIGVRFDDLPIWEKVAKDFLQTVPIDDMNVDNVLHFINKQVLQLWVALAPKPVGVLVTEIVHHPKHSVLVLKYGAGRLSLEAAKQVRAVVFPWAKMYGCTKVEVAGRKGWQRVLGLSQEIPLYRGDL